MFSSLLSFTFGHRLKAKRISPGASGSHYLDTSYTDPPTHLEGVLSYPSCRVCMCARARVLKSIVSLPTAFSQTLIVLKLLTASSKILFFNEVKNTKRGLQFLSEHMV